MLDYANILVVEDESMIALDITDCVEAAGGTVVGPVRSVAKAMALLETVPIDAAILDANLVDRDVTPVARLLASRKVPTIVYSGLGLPEELAAEHPNIPLVLKPAPASRVVKLLSHLFKEHLRTRAANGTTVHVCEPDTDWDTDIAFRLTHVLVDDGFRVGRSAFSGGKLAGVLIPVTAEEHGQSAGGWYLESGFGPCSGMGGATPPVFNDLNDAGAWLSARIVASRTREIDGDAPQVHS
jgi:CheY-like chemotaxis protein